MVYTVGHRGAAGVLPENTLRGFRYAILLGVDYVECDVHLTRDGHLVVMHDSAVDRTTDGHGAIRDLTLARVRSLDAGDGEQVPLFDEVLDLVKGEAQLLCEVKGLGTEHAAVEAVRAHGMTDDGDVYVVSSGATGDRAQPGREATGRRDCARPDRS